MSPIRVLLADDHRLFRRGLRQICELLGGFEVVGEAEDGQEAVRLSMETHPDVILMDIEMPAMDGVQAARAIIDRDPAAVVLMLTVYRSGQYGREALQAGARGFLLKDIDEEELIEAVRAAARGELVGCWKPEAGDNQRPTGSEMDVMRWVVQGADNRSIARGLGISEHTVANRLRDIYGKLQVNNRTQAALEALRRGWVALDAE